LFLCEFHKVYTFLVFVVFISCKSKKSVDFFLLFETHFLKQYHFLPSENRGKQCRQKRRPLRNPHVGKNGAKNASYDFCS
jgi:hypothetical protein